MTLNRLAMAAAFLTLPGAALAVEATKLDTTLTQAEVEAAQQAWGEGLVRIAHDYDIGGIDRARDSAAAVLDGAYGHDMGPVLFKPTLAGGEQTFRTTPEGALAYFIGHDDDFPQDQGFALKGWTGVEVENAAIFIAGDTALTMGHVHITGPDGAVTTVDKTWGFQRDAAGDLRIVLHHSSLPYGVN
ncbi:phosphoribosyl-AMP cyclohydrolase [Paracoccus aestuarii]|uniref:Phosphoribosyl-AMP cyclohydrolase n=1 Tax=Paracoccus aestuarii TaxID=453842 RepID=A0A418ZS46_9RHOB|nr:phosphoribosyl-AMP cyclohydrolase [Paracoccus aestuarii]RJK99492.1 phosphoribosyl-AMP cyclohydrolase [Paracoccus aestuarii]WCR01115.1 phosphoribosyl-AMP cyclohydrolase [Paracoccus aestuarii]